MNYLVFDTETTGTPKNYKAKMTDLDNWPRVIQLAWALFDNNKNLIESNSSLIKPNGWVIPNEKFWIDNGFSQDKSMKEGILIETALIKFAEQLNKADTLVAHNMNFDYNVLGAEMIRANLKTGKIIDKVCTMLSTIDFCAIPGNYGNKYPKLEELHKKLFDEGFSGAHDALNDVMACANCFLNYLD